MDYTKSSQQQVKENNLRMVFGIINDKEPVSRIEIKRMTGLSATTVSSLVNELMDRGLINEVGTKKTAASGRRAVMLTVNKNGGLFAGVSVFNKGISLGVYDLKFNLVFYRTIDLKQGDSITEKITDIIKKSKLLDKMMGIAVGIPAVIDIKSAEIVSSTVIDCEKERLLCENVKKNLNFDQLVLYNNSWLYAYAEKEFGSIDASTLISVDIGDGVGAGIIINDVILSGAHGMAGEFGHISINKHGEKCKCGGVGCLETAVSVPMIIKRAQKINKDILSLADIKREVSRGNTEILTLLTETAGDLSVGISNILNVIDPQEIVISGAITELGDYFLAPLCEFVNEKALYKDVRVSYTAVEGDAVTLGGAKCLFDSMLRLRSAEN